MGDPSGAKYCRRQRISQCACGFIDDDTGYCAPQTNSCSMIGCNTDAQCAAGSVCTVSAPESSGGTFTANRCRANGFCIDDAECPEQPPSTPERGYCDRATRTCNTDCRTGSTR